MTMVALGDHADRLLIRERLDETVIVEAAAGTGKTTELVWRMLNLLASGRATIDQVVAVTFTEKAAGELKLRLRQELETARHGAADPDAQARLSAAIQRLEEAHVSTIHGFCADLLRERPVEAGIDPVFTVLTEAGAERLFNEAFRIWLHEELERPGEGVRRALRRGGWSRDGRDGWNEPADRLRRAARDLAEWRDFAAAWRRDPFDRETALQGVIDRVRELAALTDRPTSVRDPLYVDTAQVRDLSRDIQNAMRFDAADPDGWEARLIDLAQDKNFRRARRGRDRAYGAGMSRDDVWTSYETLTTALDDFQRAADSDLAALLHGELRGALDRYARLKQRSGALDFIDLLLRARDLLVGHPEVRLTFQSRFTHLFVDEFQDTDPLQAEILLLLASNDPSENDWHRVTPVPGKLFIVGDPKQAIYRFRRADVETYQDVCDLLEARGARRAFLRTSFRATPAIQRVINAAFEPVMTGDRQTLQAKYVELSPSPYRADIAEQPSVVVLPVPEPYGQRRVAGYAIERSLPLAVGAFVHWLIHDSRWLITERTTRDELAMAVPIEPRHVCILFRRFLHYGDDVTRGYVEALEARGVPHLLVGGKSFHGREEVDTMRAALAAIEWPEDELSVFATLKGALFAIDDEALFLYRHQHKSFHPFRIPEKAGSEAAAIVDALRLLGRLHSRRNYRPVADTITELLTATRAHVGFVLRHAGEQALANVLHIAELSRRYEANGGVSFRGFVDELHEQAESGQAAEAPILEEGSDGVRLMTTHKAKGLEFPVVILADMTAKLHAGRADRLVDRAKNACYQRLGGWTPVELSTHEAIEICRDEAEGVRIAYVAATRARDLLVVPAVGDVEWDGGWTAPLNRAVYPSSGARRGPASAAGCPLFKKDSVRRRPDNDPATSSTVCPGHHTFHGDRGYSVVWWDPHALDLDVEAPPGLRREGLIVKDVPQAVIDAGLGEYDKWRTKREEALASGSLPSLAVRSATEWAEAGDASGLPRLVDPQQDRAARLPDQPDLFDELPQRAVVPDEPLVRLSAAVVDTRRGEHPGGIRFGELVHAVLAAAPLDAGPQAIEAMVDLHARILSAPSSEVAAAIEAVASVLAHDLLARARAAAARGACRRETPITCVLADGMVVEGVVDLAFEEDEVWTVVDYKTDRELAASGEDRYRRQVALYVSAIAQATGRSATGVLLRV